VEINIPTAKALTVTDCPSLPEGPGASEIFKWDNRDNVLRDLAPLIGESDRDRFGDLLARFFDNYAECNSVFISLFKVGQPPVRVYDNLSGFDERSTIHPYVNGAYLLDPIYNRIVEGCSAGVFRLADCVPDSFASSDYYREYYSHIGLVDECAILVDLGANGVLTISIGRRGRDAVGGTSNLGFLEAFYGCLDALCKQKWNSIFSDVTQSRSDSNDGLASASFRNFGSNILSEREREVAIMSLRGHSVKSIARFLTISPETVKIYRKRLYQKLNIRTQGELFSAFISFMSDELKTA
jgi:DNA-binding CsgD family transcriptional regulator